MVISDSITYFTIIYDEGIKFLVRFDNCNMGAMISLLHFAFIDVCQLQYGSNDIFIAFCIYKCMSIAIKLNFVK